MSVVKNQHFLVRLTDGTIWHFFTENKILQYRLLAHQSLVNYLLAEPVRDFDLDLDQGDVHLLCLTEEGFLKYFLGRPGAGWNVTPLDRYNLQPELLSCLTLKVSFPHVHILWADAKAFNDPGWNIRHVHWSGDRWTDKQVAEITGKDQIPFFCLAEDGRQNLHIVYLSAPEGTNDAFYTSFDVKSGQWGQAEKISLDSPGSVFMLLDHRQELHFVCSRKNAAGKFQICYQQPGREKNLQVIRDCAQEPGQPLMFLGNNVLHVAWQEGGSLYTAYLQRPGQTWSSPRPVKLVPGEMIYFSYLSSHPEDAGILKMPLMPGILAGENKLVFNEFLYLALLAAKTRGNGGDALPAQPAPSPEICLNISPACFKRQKIRRLSIPGRKQPPLPFKKTVQNQAAENHAAALAGLQNKYEWLSRELATLQKEKERISQQQERFQEVINKLQQESSLLAEKLLQILNQQAKDRIKKESGPRALPPRQLSKDVGPLRTASLPVVVFRSQKEA
ncbi:MAG: hypothetical protein AB1556_07930 [Bacillota bacterium]